MNSAQNLKGFRDYLPKQMIVRKKVISILKTVFEKYGFEEIQTPTLEYAEVLLGKYGEEAEKLMYIFEDPGGRKVGLNYDLTVPTARVMSQYQDLPKPFKRYQIQPAYRAENTQKGRYRQFTQCDVDILGSTSPLSDAEILAVISDSLEALSLSNFTIRVNSRQILFSLIEKAGIAKEMALPVLQSIDKLDKKSTEEVEKELSDKGISGEQVTKLFTALENAEPDENLKQVLSFAKDLGVTKIKFDPTMVRGLDYYTGTIFETVVSEPKIGSLTGGGRYDNLIKTLGGPDIPAVGTTIGMERICDVIEELALWSDQAVTSTNVFVSVFSTQFSSNSLKVTTYLRQNNINTELWLDANTKLEKQLKYADQKGIPFVIIIGEEEAKANTVTLKNLKTREQKTISLEELLTTLASSV